MVRNFDIYVVFPRRLLMFILLPSLQVRTISIIHIPVFFNVSLSIPMGLLEGSYDYYYRNSVYFH